MDVKVGPVLEALVEISGAESHKVLCSLYKATQGLTMRFMAPLTALTEEGLKKLIALARTHKLSLVIGCNEIALTSGVVRVSRNHQTDKR